MSSTIVQSTDFSTSNITFSPIKLMDSGAKMSYLSYSGRPLVMQTASMNLPYGMNVFDKAGPVKYSVDLSFRGYEEGKDAKVRAFYDVLMKLDEFMVKKGVENSQAWFKSKLSEDVVKAFYTPLVRVSKDANGNPKPYPPSFKLNLRKKQGSDVFDIVAYDQNKQAYNYEETTLEELLVKGAQITALIQCTSVWFAGSKFGLSWKGIQLRVDKLPDSIRGFAFADEGESHAAPAPAPRRSAPTPAPVQEEIDDDDAFDAPAPAPAPAKAPSVLAAVTQEEEGDEVEPIAVPKKTVVTTKKVVKVVKK
jgi:hypothetical protein